MKSLSEVLHSVPRSLVWLICVYITNFCYKNSNFKMKFLIFGFESRIINLKLIDR